MFSQSDPPRLSHRTASWWSVFLPAPPQIDALERLRLCVGVLIGILLTAALSQLGDGYFHTMYPWLVAPLGATAILVFATPSSPMAQPWAVVAGNTLSSLLGIVAVRVMHNMDHPVAASALTVALAVGLMLAMRCLHPPGGAVALMMVLGNISDPMFALHPILLNSLLMVAVGIGYNTLTRRAYPHRQLPKETADPDKAVSPAERDLDAVLKGYNQVLDISRDDLEALLRDMRQRSHQRLLKEVRCMDIMSTNLVTVEFGTSLEAAWRLLRQRNVKALPVVDRTFRIAGIVTLADFMRAADLDLHHSFNERLMQLIRRTPGDYATKPEVVGQIMQRKVRVASQHKPLADLLPLFASSGHHHIPIIGDGERLVGMVTQSDLVAVLGQVPEAHDAS